MAHVSYEQACAAQKAALLSFQRLGTVSGIGVTRVGDGFGIKVNLREPIEPGVEIPSQIDGVPVHIRVTGEIRALRASSATHASRSSEASAALPSSESR